MPRPVRFTVSELRRLQANIGAAAGKPKPKKEKGKMHEIVNEVVRLRGLLQEEIAIWRRVAARSRELGMPLLGDTCDEQARKLEEALIPQRAAHEQAEEEEGEQHG